MSEKQKDYGFCPFLTKQVVGAGGIVPVPCGKGCQLFIDNENWQGCAFKLIAITLENMKGLK
jgi:hypothetical protein